MLRQIGFFENLFYFVHFQNDKLKINLSQTVYLCTYHNHSSQLNQNYESIFAMVSGLCTQHTHKTFYDNYLPVYAGKKIKLFVI